MYCPECKQEHNGKFCPECGAPMIEKPIAEGIPQINLGDANAISGGLNVNASKNIHNEDHSIHNITNTTSTVNHITQVAAQKSEMELLFVIDKIACFFLRCHDPGFPCTFVFSDSLYHTTGYVFFKTGFPEKSIFRMQVQNHTLTNRMISAILYDYIYL